MHQIRTVLPSRKNFPSGGSSNPSLAVSCGDITAKLFYLPTKLQVASARLILPPPIPISDWVFFFPLATREENRSATPSPAETIQDRRACVWHQSVDYIPLPSVLIPYNAIGIDSILAKARFHPATSCGFHTFLRNDLGRERLSDIRKAAYNDGY